MKSMSDIMSGIPSRVQAGIAWLNSNELGWLDKIDVKRLFMLWGCDCIGGQLRGHFTEFLNIHRLSDNTANRLGFYAESVNIKGFGPQANREEYAALTDAWKVAIEELKKGKS